MTEVHFRRMYIDPQPEISTFDDPRDALVFAQKCAMHPHYLIRLRETGSDEWLTVAQVDFRLNGGIVPR